MKRLLVVLASTAALAVVAVTSASSADSGLKIVEAGATFPDRTYVLSLPKRTKLQAGQVRVLENGDRVINLRVGPAGSAGNRELGTVMLIDASNSMRGEPIKAAMAAARSFATRRAAAQPLAVVLFNDRTTITLPFTTNDADIQSALSRPPVLREGTGIYDALDKAVGLVSEQGLNAASFILLSDGADVGSKLTAESVDQRLDDHHVRVFSVGLRSGAYDPSTLSDLATRSKGGYIESSTENLQRIYSALGFQLANEYLVQYQSQAGPAQKVAVTISVAGFGSASTAYRTEAIATPVAKPFKASFFTRVVQSWITMVAIALLVMGLVFWAVWAVVRTPEKSLPERLADFVHIPTEEEAQERRLEVAAVLGERKNRSFRDMRWWRNFADEVELADVGRPAATIALWAVILGLVLMFLGVIVLGSAIGVVFFVLGPLAARTFVSGKLRRRRLQFSEQLPDNIEVLASALRAGHSLVGGLAVVVDDAPEPSKSEFKRVVADEQLGVPLEDALGVVVRRMDNSDLDQVALVASLQRDTGGNAAEVLDQVVETIRGRMEVRRLVRTLTAQGRMARWIVSFIPVVLLLAIMVINPSYADPLWHQTVGQISLVIATLLVISGSLVIRKIIDIKV